MVRFSPIFGTGCSPRRSALPQADTNCFKRAMTFLPIVARELRSASRRRSTYWLRSGAALAVIIAGTWLFLMLQRQPTRELAMFLFCTLTGGAVLSSLLSGIRSTADCLSQEKREGTLGLLFLTDLKGYDVVLGKLAATSLNAFYSILAILPMLAIPLLMGGITLGEFGRMALVAVNALFFSLSLGICVSAMSRTARKAVSTTFVLLLLFTAGPPLMGAWSVMFGSGQNPHTLYMLPSVGFNFFSAWDYAYKWHREQFWLSLGVIHAIGWIFLITAASTAPHSWQDRPRTVAGLRWRERWQLWSYGNISERLNFRRRLLEQGAFFWLAARARLKPMFVWGTLGLMGC